MFGHWPNKSVERYKTSIIDFSIIILNALCISETLLNVRLHVCSTSSIFDMHH